MGIINGAVLNGVALNGGRPLPIVDGAVSAVALCSFTAPDPNIVRPGAVSAIAAATISIDGVVIKAGAAAPVAIGVFTADGTLDAGATASFTGTATFDAGPLRSVYADVGAVAVAVVEATPDATLGAASFTGIASASFEANQVQLGAASFAGIAVVAPDGYADKYVDAVMVGTATANADAGINGVFNGAASFVGQASIDSLLLGITIQRVETQMDCVAVAEIVATIVQPGAATMLPSAVVDATANRTALTGSTLNGVAAAAFDALKIVLPTVDAVGLSELTPPSATMRHGGAIAPLGTAIATADGTLVQQAETSALGTCFITSFGDRLAVAAAAAVAVASVAAYGETNTRQPDPIERTMSRPFIDREMRRPFVDREMRAPA